MGGQVGGSKRGFTRSGEASGSMGRLLALQDRGCPSRGGGVRRLILDKSGFGYLG